MPGHFMDAHKGDLDADCGLRGCIAQVLVDTDDWEGTQCEREIETLAAAGIVQIFPIAGRDVVGVAPDGVIVPIGDRGLPAEKELILIGCIGREREPVRARQSGRSNLTPARQARIEIITPYLGVVADEWHRGVRIVERFRQI